MEASNRTEESGTRSNFPTDLGCGGCRTKATKPARGHKRTAEEHGASQSSKATSMNVLSNAMDLLEETRENTVVGLRKHLQQARHQHPW